MKRTSSIRIALAAGLMAASMGAQAGYIDFTTDAWKNAIAATGATGVASVGSITLTAVPSGEDLTFNSGFAEQLGCALAFAGLACKGDGIGISDDEVGGGVEQLNVAFGGLVDIYGVELLDLFGNEGSGETAVILQAGSHSFKASGNNSPSGYWDTGFTATGISSLILTTPNDGFSDYSLARIWYGAGTLPATTAVPEPGTLSLLGMGLLGLALIRRRGKA